MRPSHHDLPWIDQRLEAGFWDDRDNRVAYMDWLGKKLGYSKPEDWYGISRKAFEQNHGAALLSRYYSTILNAVTDFCPSYEWKGWLFTKTKDAFWKNSENQRAYMDWLGKKLGYSKPEDWYGISGKAFEQNHGGGLLSVCFNDSPMKAVQGVYPEYQLLPWKFKKCPNRYWLDDDNVRTYLEWLGKELGYSKPEDWYQISRKFLEDNYGAGVLGKALEGQPRKAAQFLFPNFDWKPWLFNQIPPNWWNKASNRKLYLDWLSERIGYSKPVDWYQVSHKIFTDNFGRGFVKFFNNSPIDAITRSFPDFDFKPWLFTKTKNAFWKNSENQRAYMDWLGKKLGYSKPEDWYGITQKAVIKNNGRGLLRYFGGSPMKAVQSVYPEYQLLPWKFKTCPNGYWLDDDNVRTYLEWLGKKLGYSKPEDWYQISKKDLISNYGVSPYSNWGGNARSAAFILFPDFDWKPWLFKLVPHGFWQSDYNCRNYMRWLEQQLGISKTEDWYRVQSGDFRDQSGSGFIKIACSGSILKAVTYLYPDFPWKPEKFRAGFRAQKRLHACVCELYSGKIVKFNYLHPELRYVQSNSKMELDVFLPELELAFEYQGEGHFFEIKTWGGEKGLKSQKERDAEKRNACTAKGITLIEVPYSWDGSKAALKKLIEAETS